mmetsp:Transcript_38313/g.114720  ORF Transcript_38313/g.114720 Transcript_38313/m.114720 type:complete len:222 (-) Transcript_38313:1766-2431(-)
MGNICGDHYFDYGHHSKMGVHNRTRDAYFVALRTVASHCRVIESPDQILLKPTGLSRRHPRKRPADVAIRPTHKMCSLIGFDFTIAGTPRASATTKNQHRNNSSNLRRKEILKWGGTTRIKKNETNINVSPHKKAHGHNIINEMLQTKKKSRTSCLRSLHDDGHCLRTLCRPSPTAPQVLQGRLRHSRWSQRRVSHEPSIASIPRPIHVSICRHRMAGYIR